MRQPCQQTLIPDRAADRGGPAGEIPHWATCDTQAIFRIMKTNHSIKRIVGLLGSLVILVAQADAKPGKGNSGSKGKSGNSHSQRMHKGNGPNHESKADHKNGKNQKNDKHSELDRFTRFKDHERDEIVDYFGRYRTHGNGLPPGLAMNQRRGKPMPPGWQKKLVPGYRISDQEWRNYSPVPSSWFPRMRMEPDTRLYHYGDRVVRMYEPRREVIDVITLPGYR